ncbi:MAG: hypothetical protein ACTSSL_09495 [Candidatus Heimdallarchaeaceae archaeon]
MLHWSFPIGPGPGAGDCCTGAFCKDLAALAISLANPGEPGPAPRLGAGAGAPLKFGVGAGPPRLGAEVAPPPIFGAGAGPELNLGAEGIEGLGVLPPILGALGIPIPPPGAPPNLFSKAVIRASNSLIASSILSVDLIIILPKFSSSLVNFAIAVFVGEDPSDNKLSRYSSIDIKYQNILD